jgi:hypothetical protein
MKLLKNEIRILQALARGKSLTEVIITYNTDSHKINSIVAKYENLKKGAPKQYSLSPECDILLNGRKINSCRELHQGNPENQPWFSVEKSCLLCLIQQNNTNNKSSLLALCKEVQPYFHRETNAIYQMALSLSKKK